MDLWLFLNKRLNSKRSELLGPGSWPHEGGGDVCLLSFLPTKHSLFWSLHFRNLKWLCLCAPFQPPTNHIYLPSVYGHSPCQVGWPFSNFSLSPTHRTPKLSQHQTGTQAREKRGVDSPLSPQTSGQQQSPEHGHPSSQAKNRTPKLPMPQRTRPPPHCQKNCTKCSKSTERVYIIMLGSFLVLPHCPCPLRKMDRTSLSRTTSFRFSNKPMSNYSVF